MVPLARSQVEPDVHHKASTQLIVPQKAQKGHLVSRILLQKVESFLVDQYFFTLSNIRQSHALSELILPTHQTC